MKQSEAPVIAELHREGIPQGFLSRIGPGFRAEMYRGIALAARSGVWVAVNSRGEIYGFICGTAHIGRCYRSVLLRRGLVMVVYALPALIRPTTWKHIIETMTYPRREITEAPEPEGAARESEPTAELLSIVVGASGRGSGAAGQLVAALEDGLREWQHLGVYRVVTMAADPRSNAFYRKVGFRHVREFQHHGVAMNLYHKAPTA